MSMDKKEKEIVLSKLNAICENTLMETLNIEFCDVGEDFVVAKMPVNAIVHQPEGFLHGGASVALAESVGSASVFYFLKHTKKARGIEISANHVRGIRAGYVFARSTPLHLGRTTQLWRIDITNEEGELISSVKLTTLTLDQ